MSLNSLALNYFGHEYAYALATKDACMIKLFLMYHSKLNKIKYHQLINSFFSRECLKSMPDMRFSVKWHCDSDFIPFLSKLAPHDTISIFKS